MGDTVFSPSGGRPDYILLSQTSQRVGSEAERLTVEGG